MRNKVLFYSMCMILIFKVNIIYAAEKIELESYYPSPAGFYNQLKARKCAIGGNQTTGELLPVGAYTLYVDHDSDSPAPDLVVTDNSGNVGIGIAQPQATLEINGNIMRSIVGAGQTNECLGDKAFTQINLGINGSKTDNECTTVGGGGGNQATGRYSTVSGGVYNTASANIGTQQGCATVSGGYSNTASGQWSSICGGSRNNASGDYSTVCGGNSNTASGENAAVCGGHDNEASQEYSFAIGYRAKANKPRSFVWSDGGETSPGYGEANDEGYTFNIYAINGIYFNGGKIHDVAEYMDVLRSENAEEGDILSIKGPARLSKASIPYSEKIIGVVSGERTCSFYMGNNTPQFNDTERLPIALVGMAFVKVNNENGPIKIGDPITSGSTPGIGMKATRAGKIVGYAMEELKEAEGTILVFVNLSYYIPPKEYMDLKTRLEKLEKQAANLKL